MRAAHLAHQTGFSRAGKVNMHNRKPFRTASQKAEAKRTARKDKDGVWRSSAPVSFHRAPSGRREE